MKQYIILLCLLSMIISPDVINKEVKKYKFRTMFPSPSAIANPNEKISEFTYKNINLSENEIQVYLSTNESDDVINKFTF
jgi:hypothetical protein